MILQHRDGSVSYVALFRCQVCVHVGVKVATQFFDDDGTVGDLGSIEFDERQLALVRAELHLVVHILQKQEKAERVNDVKINNYIPPTRIVGRRREQENKS